MPDLVTLVGLDFGTTTSSAVVASASLIRNAVSGRTELSDLRERFRSDLVFTPLDGDRLDLDRTAAQLDTWLAAAKVRPREVFGGGALLTGLTAQKDNAAGLVALIRERLGEALIATADDPCLESWLAFLGSCDALSRSHPDRLVLNLDGGGGTTNLALGRDGNVLRTGCLFVGARHVQVVPGTYRIVRVSNYARAALDALGIVKAAGGELNDTEVSALVDFWVGLLEDAVGGRPFADPVRRLHEQIPFTPADGDPILTLSGGVGELVYAHLAGKPWPATTFFGDLGIDLARRLLDSPRLGRDLRDHVPASAGRATVYGLLRHNTEISSSTVFLPRPDLLPLTDLPVLGAVGPGSDDSHISDIIFIIQHSSRGGCVYVALEPADGATVRALGARLAAALRRSAFPPGRPLVLLVRENLGKVLGHYVTEWGALPLDVIALDEVPARGARFVQIGRPRQNVVPVSFYGLNESGAPPCAT